MVEPAIKDAIEAIQERDARIAALEAQLAERVKEAAVAGWNACRKSLYAVCEDVSDQADRLEPDTQPRNEGEAQHAKGYYAGQRYTAKSISRGFGAMNAEDDDNLIAAYSALETTPPAPKVTEADTEWLFEFRENWVNDGSRPNYQQMAKAYAAKMHPWEAAASIYEGRFEDALTAAQESGQ